MSDNLHKHPIKMRTFAADMDAVRKQSGAKPEPAVSQSEPAVTTPGPTPQAMPASFNRPNPEKIQPAVTEEVANQKTEGTPVSEAPIVITEPTKKVPLPPRAANTPIPAFHELQKSVSHIQENIVAEKSHQDRRKKKTEKPEPVKNVERPNIGYDATVITDTKSDRFQLFPSVVTAIKNWFAKLKTTRRKKATPKYTIPEAERRKGVIQRATSKTGTLFTADSETLREQIRQRRIQEEQEAEEPETIWSPYTETGYGLLETAKEPPVSAVQNVAVEYKRTPQFVEPNNPTLVIPKPPASTNLTAAETTDLSPLETADTIESEEDLLAEARWAGSAGSTIEAPKETTFNNTKYTDKPLTVSAYQDEESEQFLPPTQPTGHASYRKPSETNTLTITLLVGIIGAIAIFFAARMLFTHLSAQSAPSIEPVVSKSEPILSEASLVAIPISVQTLNHIPALLAEAIASSSGELAEFAITSATGDEMSPSYLFEILHFETKANLRQSLTAAHFVVIDQSKPGLLLSFVDEDAVRGGLLQWEPHMLKNLGLFHNNTTATSASFVDRKIDNIDVRVLTTADGQEKVLYGFLSDNVVLITASSVEFSEVVSQGRR